MAASSLWVRVRKADRLKSNASPFSGQGNDRRRDRQKRLAAMGRSYAPTEVPLGDSGGAVSFVW